jgi:hypothetical protein
MLTNDVMSPASSSLWIETDHKGVIVGWSADALPLTGYSARAMYGLLLPIMFVADPPLGGECGRDMRVHPNERQGLIRSRDDRATRVRYGSAPAPHSSDLSRIITRWTFEPV